MLHRSPPSAVVDSVGGAHYAASKGGVISLTRSIAKESRFARYPSKCSLPYP